MKSENPFDILNCFRANGSSFHVKAVFSPETGNEKEGKPMAAFNHFSRLVITIIDNDNVRFVDANIQYELLAEIIGRGRYALEKVYKREFEPVHLLIFRLQKCNTSLVIHLKKCKAT